MNSIDFSKNLSAQQQRLWLEDTKKRLPEDSPDALLYACAACFSASSHLDRASVLFAEDIPVIWAGCLQDILDDATATFSQHLLQNQDSENKLTDDLKKAVSQYRNRTHFAIAMSEILGVIAFDKTLNALSEIAQTAVKLAVEYLIYPQRAEKSGWFILALGKLGAEELNYSSDIDLISFHTVPRNEAQDHTHYIALTKQLSSLLSSQSAYGESWRVDLRLRPDPSATAVSVSTQSALQYYQSKARSWERAAFIRARPIAGDIDAANLFLAKIESFIWRRNLDYTVVDDLQIMLQHKPASPGFLGFDLKIGAFSIRHIELFCHILQLLAGGRNTQLRTHHTLTALDALGEAGWLSDKQGTNLKEIYLSWRKLEHRLQYRQDNHTHSLPRNADEFSAFASFAGFKSTDELVQHIQQLQQKTEQFSSHQTMNKLVAEKTHDTVSQDQFSTTTDANRGADTALAEKCEQLGYQRIEDIQNTIQKWQAGEIAATRNEKARQNLDRLLDVALQHIADAPKPDSTFFAFASMLEKLNAGAQLFALLAEYPHLCRLVSESISQSETILGFVSTHPELLDLWVDERFFTPLPASGKSISPPSITEEDVAEQRVDIQDILDTIRLHKREVDIKAALHLLRGISPFTHIAALLSQTAKFAIEKMAQAAMHDIQRRYGRLEGFNFAIIGLGRLGASTMKLDSDLDLMFVYQSDNHSISDGGVNLGATGYALKLAQRLVSFLSTATAQGQLYEVDLRLRPDGNAGPLATHIDRLTSYTQEQAWPWEAIAFRKARLIWQSNPDFSKQHKGTDLSAFICKMAEHFKSIPLASLRSDIQAMVGRLEDVHPSALDLKKRKGGLLTAEFLASIIDHPEIVMDGHSEKIFAQAFKSKESLEEIWQLLALTTVKKENDETLNWLGNMLKLPNPRSEIDHHCEVIAKALNYALAADGESSLRPI